ncbi:hypothetical protein ACWGUL_01235 [Streptomyces albidoflavus]
MRKRQSRPYRFAAVENTAIDGLGSVLAIGLLTTLIRAKDGDEVTVESLCKKYAEGREALSKAMRALVEDGYVVKFKVQRAASEVATEAGERVSKRGGSWYTTFTVDSVAFSAEDVAEMLADIYADGNVRSHRVEPERLDPAKNGSAGWQRPTSGIPSVGATCNDAPQESTDEGDSPLSPTYGFPTVGGPTVGRSAAHIRKKTSSPETETEDEIAPPARSAPDARRATTGSRGSSSSGFAASGNKKSLTNTQRAQVQAVRDLLPPLLARDLPDETPTNISKKILAALDTDGPRPRTPEQLAAYRINPRWDGYWATQYGDDGFDKPLGVVLALVASQVECGNVRCDDRRDVDTGELCPFCAELKADRRVQRRLEQQDAARAAERPSEPRGTHSGDVVPPPRPEAASWAPAAPEAWPTVATPAEDTPAVSTVEIPSPDEVQARTADMRSILRDHRSRPSRAPF